MAISSSDLAIAIGEDAFNAGWEACMAYRENHYSDPYQNLHALNKAWDEYVPPAELCGEDF